MQHSNGPWELVESATHFYILGTKAEGKDFRPFVVQRQKTCFAPSEEARVTADMHAIAALPDLISAARAALKCMEGEGLVFHREARELREAIAKATGYAPCMLREGVAS